MGCRRRRPLRSQTRPRTRSLLARLTRQAFRSGEGKPPSPDRHCECQEGGFMNFIVRIVVGAITGWLTGKLVEIEGRSKVVGEGHVLDVIYGIVGGIAGEYLFFWIVIGNSNAFSAFA